MLLVASLASVLPLAAYRASPGSDSNAHRAVVDAYGQLPLSFVANAGQTDPDVRYAAQAGGASFWFTPSEAVFSFARQDDGVNLRLGFLGANPAPAIEGTDVLAGKVNYLLGNDPSAWQTSLPTYGELVYRDLWPGIDLAFRGEAGSLKYEFRVAPGADASNVRLAYRGADALAISPTGDLILSTAVGPITDARPVSYQLVGGERVSVESHYALAGSAYGFALGAYDPSRPLVIDPGLLYSTFLGGSGFDAGQGIAVDGLGSAYVTGQTASTNFPTTLGAFDTSHNGNSDAFVTKLDVTGSTLLYSTFLGGSGLDAGQGIAVDAVGSAYVTGQTQSPAGFPTTPGAFDTTKNAVTDAFVTKLDASGSGLLYSTFLGGSNTDDGRGIAVDAAGSAYVTGFTASTDFPTTLGAFDTSHNGAQDAFVTKLNAFGSAPLVYSTFLGGGDTDIGRGVAVDAAGSAYVTGQTHSTGFPTTTGAFDTSHNGRSDAFVTKLNASGSDPLLYSTFLGGSNTDDGQGIAVDGLDNAYVTGFTASTNFPTTAGAFDTSHNGFQDAFVTKLNASGSGPLLYSTFLGGSNTDIARGIAVDGLGSAYVTGQTASTNFPTTTGAFDTSHNGGTDAFVTKLDLVGTPTTLTLSPTADINEVGTSHTVTATVTDSGGQPVPDVLVRFSVTGSVTTSGSCTTDANGQCDFTYQGPDFPGADVITAFADTDDDAMQDVGEPTGAAEKTWVLPPSTPLCEVTISDGGRITAANGDKATFGGNAKVSSSGEEVSGQQRYTDHGPVQPLKVHSTNVLTVVCSLDQTEATLYGEATIDGAGSFFYRIRLKDGGEPGKGVDQYGILLSAGYFSGDQTLEGGNVQITVHE